MEIVSQPKFNELPSSELEKYKPLKSVDGFIVGWICRECGRLFEADHRKDCSQAGAPEEKKETQT